MIKDYEVIQKLRDMKEFEKKCEGIPRSWGSPLEELYEKYWALYNLYVQKVMQYEDDTPEFKGATEKTQHYYNLMCGLRKNNEILAIWGAVNFSIGD